MTDSDSGTMTTFKFDRVQPHGGYPTPRYEEAPMRRRLTSLHLYGHSGAWVWVRASAEMRAAGEGRRLT